MWKKGNAEGEEAIGMRYKAVTERKRLVCDCGVIWGHWLTVGLSGDTG